jgi:hypothetical protein
MQIDELSSRLLPGEKILWSGQPKQGLLFTPRDVLLIPFSLVWGGFAIFWEVSVLKIMPRVHAGAAHGPPPIFFPLFGAVFVCIGLFFIFGRFIADMVIRNRTLYALTNQRILILRSGPANAFVALNLERLPGLTLSEGRAGRGTISFGDQAAGYARAASFSWIPSLSPIPRFLAIEDARTVFDQIQRVVRPAGG